MNFDSDKIDKIYLVSMILSTYSNSIEQYNEQIWTPKQNHQGFSGVGTLLHFDSDKISKNYLVSTISRANLDPEKNRQGFSGIGTILNFDSDTIDRDYLVSTISRANLDPEKKSPRIFLYWDNYEP